MTDVRYSIYFNHLTCALVFICVIVQDFRLKVRLFGSVSSRRSEIPVDSDPNLPLVSQHNKAAIGGKSQFLTYIPLPQR